MDRAEQLDIDVDPVHPEVRRQGDQLRDGAGTGVGLGEEPGVLLLAERGVDELRAQAALASSGKDRRPDLPGDPPVPVLAGGERAIAIVGDGEEPDGREVG